MEFLGNIRENFARNRLRKKAAETKHLMSYSNFDNVKSIGIVWDATNSNEINAIKKFRNSMKEKKISLDILAYFHGKTVPPELTSADFITLITRKELGFFYTPESENAKSFMEKKFDVLIDINISNYFPLYFISTLSKASFRVGIGEAGSIDSPFDLMIGMKYPVEVDNYLSEVIKYLKMMTS